MGSFEYDEHTQVLEFGGMKLGIVDESTLSWEYAAKMRPSIQPLMVYCTHKILAVVGADNPFTVPFVLRLFAAALSLLSIHLLLKAFQDKFTGEKARWNFFLLSFFLWFSVYHAVRFSSENLSGRTFVIAFALFFLWKEKNLKQHFFIGLILGFSFLFRYQTGFLIAGFMAWMLFINKTKWRELFSIMLGILAVFALGVVIDYWFYNEWVLSTWEYFRQNIILDKASGFGRDPWYYYLVQIFNRGIPPFSLLYLLPVVLLFFKPKNVLLWIILPFLLLHFYIPHKELRFFFPLIGFIPLLIMESGEIIKEKWNILHSKFFKVANVLFWIHNFVFLAIISLKSADAQVPMYELIYNKYTEPTVIYYVEHNPYSRAREVYYYKRKNLEVRKVNSINEVKSLADTTVLFATINTEEAKQMDATQTLIYSALPNWLKHFNVFNWVERTKFWKVYQVDKKVEVNTK